MRSCRRAPSRPTCPHGRRGSSLPFARAFPTPCGSSIRPGRFRRGTRGPLRAGDCVRSRKGREALFVEGFRGWGAARPARRGAMAARRPRPEQRRDLAGEPVPALPREHDQLHARHPFRLGDEAAARERDRREHRHRAGERARSAPAFAPGPPSNSRSSLYVTGSPSTSALALAPGPRSPAASSRHGCDGPGPAGATYSSSCGRAR
jgi:hypothetical protein